MNSPEELASKPILANEDMEKIISAFEYMEFPSYNIDPKDVDFACMYHIKKLQRSVFDSRELEIRSKNLLYQARICKAAASRSNFFTEVLEYKKSEILSSNETWNVFRHIKEFFQNFSNDFRLLSVKLKNNPILFVFHFLQFAVSIIKNAFVMTVKSFWEVIHSSTFIRNFQGPIGRKISSKAAFFISLFILCIILYSVNRIYIFGKTAWKDLTTDISKPVEELQTGYVKSSYIIAKDRENQKEILAIPFGTRLHFRKVSINAEKYALYIPEIDAYIYDEELSSTEPSQVQSKICILFLSDSKFVPRDKYKREIPTVKIELFSEHYRIFDEKGIKTEEGYYQIKKNSIVLRSGSRSLMLKYLGDGYFDGLMIRDI